MKFDLMDKKVGDTVYDSGKRSDHRMNRSYTSVYEVVKVARKYLTAVEVGSNRDFQIQIDRETGYLKAEWGAYRFYASKEAYDAETERRKICVALKEQFLGYGTPLFEGVSNEDLLEAMRLLQIPYVKKPA